MLSYTYFLPLLMLCSSLFTQVKINTGIPLYIKHLSIILALMKVEIDNLKTVGNYKKKIGRNRSRIYQMINEEKLKIIKIDGVIFIQDKDK